MGPFKKSSGGKLIIVGLTGSMAVGKTTIVKMIRYYFKIPVWDADQVVRDLLIKNSMVKSAVIDLFPQACDDFGNINRSCVRDIVFHEPEKLKELEKLLHPVIKKQRLLFYKMCRKQGIPLCVVDIPLLFETKTDVECDVVVTASSPVFLQKQRILRRPGMTPKAMRNILQRQWPDHLKRKKADYVITSGIGKHVTFQQLKHLFSEIGRKNERNCP